MVSYQPPGYRRQRPNNQENSIETFISLFERLRVPLSKLLSVLLMTDGEIQQLVVKSPGLSAKQLKNSRNFYLS